MTGDALCQRLPVKMPPIFRHLRMTTQAVIETQDRLSVGFVTSGALESHRRFRRERLALELHPRMTVKAQLSLRLKSGLFRDQKLMTVRAVKSGHPADVDARLGVTLGAVLRFGFHGVQ